MEFIQDRSLAVAELAEAGVEVVRVSYPDLHGICRSKDIPVAAFAEKCDHGMAQTEAVMTIDLRHNVVSGSEHGFRDFWAVPDLTTLVRLPTEPGVAWCLADGRDLAGERFALDPRGVLRTQLDALAELGFGAIVGPELEFYLVDPESWRPYAERDSSVYTCGPLADPRGILRELVAVSGELGLRPLAATHEYGRGQYEINLDHGDALDAADRAFRFKALVKDVAARHGLLGTFIGKLDDEDDGSGFHLHVSLIDRDRTNVFDDGADGDGLSAEARCFAAGILTHLPALTAFLNPTVNAYRRFTPDSLAPTHVNWGFGTRLSALRAPVERGPATRLELRTGDGTANPHLAIAAVLAAGRDGIERSLEPPAPMPPNPYELEEDGLGEPLPSSLEQALERLRADKTLTGSLGDALCDAFLAIKGAELDRWRAELAKVTEWERREYTPHL